MRTSEMYAVGIPYKEYRKMDSHGLNGCGQINLTPGSGKGLSSQVARYQSE
jgi:hypothetical protein